ncbi:hypothetical protein WJX72_004447 [[Myrmecia] bisecta]|uniref:SGNH hydrolase-type esterase domain-containing protein n=1 Tax=[Myrmecia] bisecta TaxID=41462 RepID=A0AAW1QAL1_9CHLO
MSAKRAHLAVPEAHADLSKRSPSGVHGASQEQQELLGRCEESISEQLGVYELEPEQPRSPIVVAGEYALVATLALAIIYMLLLSNRQTDFSSFKALRADWALPRADTPGWLQQHEQYVEAIINARENKGLQLVFYGDTVLELLRGTQNGQPVADQEALVGVFSDHYREWRAEVLAISGDASNQLMWRLRNGEAPAGLHAQALVLLTGMHDLTYASFKGDAHILPAANGTVSRIVKIVGLLQDQAPEAEIVLLGMLPRGDHTQHPEEHMFRQPSKFTPAIAVINQQLRAWADGKPRISYLDCGAAFLMDDGHKLHSNMFDLDLKPNTKGLDALASCVDPIIEKHIRLQDGH